MGVYLPPPLGSRSWVSPPLWVPPSPPLGPPPPPTPSSGFIPSSPRAIAGHEYHDCPAQQQQINKNAQYTLHLLTLHSFISALSFICSASLYPASTSVSWKCTFVFTSALVVWHNCSNSSAVPSVPGKILAELVMYVTAWVLWHAIMIISTSTMYTPYRFWFLILYVCLIERLDRLDSDGHSPRLSCKLPVKTFLINSAVSVQTVWACSTATVTLQHRTDSSGETGLALHTPSSSWAGRI